MVISSVRYDNPTVSGLAVPQPISSSPQFIYVALFF
jgi:hypothetical protein